MHTKLKYKKLMTAQKSKTDKAQINQINLEKILTEKGLLTKESILNDVINNQAIRQTGKIILAAVFISGAIALSIAAPNIFSGLGGLRKSFFKNKKSKIKKSDWQKIRMNLYNLKNNKLIKWSESGDKIILKITPKGRRLFIKKRMRDLKIKKQQKWDRLWRIVMFDIPNNLGIKRDIFRQKLKNLGFYQFQKSAYIIPYPCQQELEATLEYYNLYDYVTYIEATHISGEQKCQRYFGL
ncbi:hypothetical protein KJ866_00075 [Patescibacteria group bacterium]|nr:hypothetical protein [Patescibacteria group bacterium]